MWFKNLSLFRFTEPFTLADDELADKLEALRFRPCGSHEESSFGWTAPLGKAEQALVYATNGYMMLCVKKEERVLPTAVVNEMIQEKRLRRKNNMGVSYQKKNELALRMSLFLICYPRLLRFPEKSMLILILKVVG